MTRKRIIDAGLCYYVTSVTRNREPLLKDEKAALFLIHTLAYHKFIYDYMLYGFVVMPDHFHAVIQPQGSYTISQIMHHIKGTFARKYNAFSGHKGHVWQKGYYDRIIRGPQHLRKTIDYTHANPVRAGLAKSVEDYPYSSYWLLQGHRKLDRFLVDHFE